MSDIDLAINRSKSLESLLERKLGATGKGLHEKVSSVESRLPSELVRKIRLVATVRNKIVHEADYKRIDDRAKFIVASKDAERQLKALGGGGGRAKIIAAVVTLVIIVVVFVAIFRHWL